jgi:hypothetical protein
MMISGSIIEGEECNWFLDGWDIGLVGLVGLVGFFRIVEFWLDVGRGNWVAVFWIIVGVVLSGFDFLIALVDDSVELIEADGLVEIGGMSGEELDDVSIGSPPLIEKLALADLYFTGSVVMLKPFWDLFVFIDVEVFIGVDFLLKLCIIDGVLVDAFSEEFDFSDGDSSIGTLSRSSQIDDIFSWSASHLQGCDM